MKRGCFVCPKGTDPPNGRLTVGAARTVYAEAYEITADTTVILNLLAGVTPEGDLRYTDVSRDGQLSIADVTATLNVLRS